MAGVAAHHRAKALDALVYAFDANIVLTRIGTPERFDEVKKRRDKAIEEFLDEALLAAELVKEAASQKR